MRIAVAGGTGVVGTELVRTLVAAGHQPVVLSRSRGVDLTDGRGLDAALEGVEAVVDVSNVTTVSRRRSREFFTATTTHLASAAAARSVGHLVVLSIVGIDRIDFGYYEGKRLQERLVSQGGVPFTILRATQFHEFAGQTLDRSPGPVAVVPQQSNQPVAAREVGAVLAELAVGAPSTRRLEMAGPAPERLVEMARRVERARGGRRPVVGLRLPGAAGRAMVAGALLPTGDHLTGRTTFDEWLAAEVAADA